jgi:hypothetical protein
LGGFEGEPDDDNNVELEKSIVLLMGPTCSALVKHLQPMWLEFPILNCFVLQSCIPGKLNKKSFDTHLKTIVLKQYRGIRSQVNFASFFLLNVRESMRLEVGANDCNEAFLA